jgi:histone-lysine N-methyltransferase SETD2
VKKFVKDYMDKAVQKKTVREVEKKDDKHAKEHAKSKDPVEAASPSTPDEKAESEGVDEVPASPNAENLDSQEANPDDLTNGDLKRKREGDGDLGSPKRTRTNELAQEPVLPPPPPPPPTADMPVDGEGILYAGVEDSAKPVLRADGCVSPMQLATPPTTISGSSEHESDGREATVRLANGMPKTTIKVGGVV